MKEFRDYEDGEIRRERATKRNGDEAKLCRMTVKSASGTTRSEMLPSDPQEVARILKERRSKSPAKRVKDRLAAEMTKRIGRR